MDLDLEKFFDQVCHDRLRSRLAQRIADKRVLQLIRASLHAGMLENGLITVPEAGTPQGSPLSPFLSHGVLDEVDKELDVHFINSLPVKQRPACTVWADKRPAQIV